MNKLKEELLKKFGREKIITEGELSYKEQSIYCDVNDLLDWINQNYIIKEEHKKSDEVNCEMAEELKKIALEKQKEEILGLIDFYKWREYVVNFYKQKTGGVILSYDVWVEQQIIDYKNK